MEGLPSGYRPNVGVCLINDDNLVFVASRLNVPGAWQMPQGGVEDDEDPKLAAVRALREETGVVSAEIIAEVPKWLTYDFPPTVRTKVNRLWGGGQWHGQAQKWYLMRLTKDNSEVNLANGETDTEFSEWKWATPDEVIEQAADYKRPTYEEVVRTFRPYLEPTGISESEMETSTTRPLEFPSQNPKTLILEEEEERHIRIAGLLKDAIFNNLSGKYVNEYHSTINAEHLKSQIERHLLEQLPFFRTPSHPPYASMIQRAIVELGEEGGSSEKTISEFIKREYEDLPWAHTVLVKRHLGKLCESGELEGSKCGLYMFPVEDKKLLRKKKKKRRGKGRDCLQRVVKDRDEIDDVKRRKQSLKLGTKGEVDKGIEEKSTDSCTEQSKGIEEDDRAQGCLVGVVEEASERKDGGVVKIEEKSGEERRAMEEQTEVLFNLLLT